MARRHEIELRDCERAVARFMDLRAAAQARGAAMRPRSRPRLTAPASRRDDTRAHGSPVRRRPPPRCSRGAASSQRSRRGAAPRRRRLRSARGSPVRALPLQWPRTASAAHGPRSTRPRQAERREWRRWRRPTAHLPRAATGDHGPPPADERSRDDQELREAELRDAIRLRRTRVFRDRTPAAVQGPRAVRRVARARPRPAVRRARARVRRGDAGHRASGSGRSSPIRATVKEIAHYQSARGASHAADEAAPARAAGDTASSSASRGE